MNCGEIMMKKKFIKLFAILSFVFFGALEMGWRFFNMVVCCKRGEQKKERKKWFEPVSYTHLDVYKRQA